MTQFFKKSQTVAVSHITEQGWWIENTTEHVSKGTALGPDYTQNIYTPSKEGMIARYDRGTDTWSDEITDKTWKPYWDIYGHSFLIGEPDGDYPDWAIKEEPSEHDPENQTVFYKKETGWKVYPIELGKPYYDEEATEFLVSDYNFELPENCSWETPPEAEEGHVVRLRSGKWTQVIDHRGKVAYAKDRDNAELLDYQIEKPGEIPETHTLNEPDSFDSWSGDKTGWQYDIERHRPFKTEEEKSWRSDELTRVINRIDQYEKDQHYPAELRTSPITSEADFLKLLQDRKALSDYPESKGFPFASRPVLSGLAD